MSISELPILVSGLSRRTVPHAPADVLNAAEMGISSYYADRPRAARFLYSATEDASPPGTATIALPRRAEVSERSRRRSLDASRRFVAFRVFCQARRLPSFALISLDAFVQAGFGAVSSATPF